VAFYTRGCWRVWRSAPVASGRVARPHRLRFFKVINAVAPIFFRRRSTTKNKFFTSEGRRRCSRRRSTTPSTTRRCNVVICIGLLDYVIGGREGEVATLTTEKKWREWERKRGGEREFREYLCERGNESGEREWERKMTEERKNSESVKYGWRKQ
jgi:hypothetical protein